MEELYQRVFGLGAFAVVAGREEPLVGGRARPLGQRPELRQAAADRRDEALLAVEVGGRELDDRRRGLVGAVRPPEALHRLCRLPPGLHQVVNPPAALRGGGVVGVVARPGAAGIGEDQNRLPAVLEGVDLVLVGGSRAALLLAADFPVLVGLEHIAGRAPRHLGGHVDAEVVEDQVERPLWHVDGGELVDQLLAHGDRLGVLDRVALAVVDRDARLVAVLVEADFKLLRRERPHHQLDELVLGGDVEVLRVRQPFGGGSNTRPSASRQLLGNQTLASNLKVGLPPVATLRQSVNDLDLKALSIDRKPPSGSIVEEADAGLTQVTGVRSHARS